MSQAAPSKTLRLLGLAGALFLGACAAPHPFPSPDATWQTHSGQLKVTQAGQSMIGEVQVHRHGARSFQLELQKAGLALIKVSADEQIFRAEGLLARGKWQGFLEDAPYRLRGWAALPAVFTAAEGPGAPAQGRCGTARFAAERSNGRLSRLQVQDEASRSDFQFVFAP